jgi:hypothetical protein
MDIYQERLYAALDMVMSAARSEIAQCQELIGQTPIPGRSQQEHDNYYRVRKNEAEDVSGWLHWQMRKIRPD